MIYGLGWTNWLRLGRLAGDRARVLLRLRHEPQPARTQPKPALSARPWRDAPWRPLGWAQGPALAVALLAVIVRRHRRLRRDRRLEPVGRVLHDGHHGHDGRLRRGPPAVARGAGLHGRPPPQRRRRGPLHVHAAHDARRRGRACRSGCSASGSTRMLDTTQRSLHHLRLRPHRRDHRPASSRASASRSSSSSAIPERMQPAMEHGFARRRGRRQPARTCCKRVGIDRARGLIAAVGTDAENVYAVLSARADAARPVHRRPRRNRGRERRS